MTILDSVASPAGEHNTTEIRVSDLKHTSFRTSAGRAAIFIPGSQFMAQHIYVKLPTRWHERFDGNPTMLPVSEEHPPEVPLLILQSQSGEWRCSITRARIDLFHNTSSTDHHVDPRMFFEEACDFLIEFREVFNLRVGRLAAICTRYLEMERPGQVLANHFCREDRLKSPLKRTESFELHAHKRFHLYEDLNVNSWIRNKTGTLRINNSPIVLVEQDINTLAEQAPTREFDNQEIRAFFDHTSEELDTILALYYPA
jgi:hypothetical protein